MVQSSAKQGKAGRAGRHQRPAGCRCPSGAAAPVSWVVGSIGTAFLHCSVALQDPLSRASYHESYDCGTHKELVLTACALLRAGAASAVALAAEYAGKHSRAFWVVRQAR